MRKRLMAWIVLGALASCAVASAWPRQAPSRVAHYDPRASLRLVVELLEWSYPMRRVSLAPAMGFSLFALVVAAAGGAYAAGSASRGSIVACVHHKGGDFTSLGGAPSTTRS